jgi:transcriptional regulator with XRE-family HTH domain
MRFHNNIGLQVCCGRSGWSQSTVATRLELAGFDISRSGVSKIEARLRFVDDKDLMFLAEVLKVPIQELFPRRESPGRLSDFMEKLETTRF